MKKRLSLILIIVIFGLIGATLGLSFVRQTNGIDLKSSPPISVSLPTTSPAPTESPYQSAEPKTISIPKINIQAEVEQVEQDFSGRMDVPKQVNNVGWYSLGYKPGEKGSAVMAGHLDTMTGTPAVFYNIDQLSPGDQVIVTDAQGKNLTFEVIRIQNYPFDQVPLQEVFASNDKPRLNLITCIGTWDVGARNYSNRLVVYTELRS